MTNDQIAAFIGRHADGWNRRDPLALSLDHAEQGVIVSPMFGRVENRLGIHGTYTALFAVFPDWALRFDAPIVQDNRMAVFFSVTATHQGDFMGLPGSGRRCAFEGVSLFDLDPELLIREERRVYDFTGLLTQLGVLRVRPAR
jgi:predicted ester cyclase